MGSPDAVVGGDAHGIDAVAACVGRPFEVGARGEAERARLRVDSEQMRVRAAFDPEWLLNPAKVFPLDGRVPATPRAPLPQAAE